MAEVMTLPQLGENIAAADVTRVLVKPGDRLEQGQAVIEVETDKAAIEVPSTVEGVVEAVRVKQGDRVAVGAEIVAVAEPATASRAQAVEPPTLRDQPHRLPASPSVRRLAREIGVDLVRVPGSGPGGRITMEDVKVFATSGRRDGDRGPSTEALPLPPLPDLERHGAVTREAMSSVRRTTAERVARSWALVPHVTQHDHADITLLEEVRRAHAGKVEERGGRLTVTAIIVKVVAAALRLFPRFNASVDMEAHEIVHRGRIDIGVAVDTERGLLVPVIREADRKSILQLAIELSHLSRRARDHALAVEEMQGATFTISNLGGIGGSAFTPIIDWPQAAILGVSRAGRRPVWSGTEFRPRLVLPLALSYDHRLIDGADGARFLRWVCDALEQPLLLLL